jgi:CRP-like cAMP-binding protein
MGDSLHKLIELNSGEVFLEIGKPCEKIGQLNSGVMRGYVYDKDGNEITTHFYQEGDMVIGGYLPNVNMSFTIEAIEDCEIDVADYKEVMSRVNKDDSITLIINREFEKINKQLQSRLVSLLNLNSVEKYELFLEEYPGLVNRIPHYYIAQYLGITPTQLSRARKKFVESK